jgi:ribosome-binding protein aMBF1 (putative translation factor)
MSAGSFVNTQDWDPIVFRKVVAYKPPAKSDKGYRKPSTRKSFVHQTPSDKPAWKIEQIAESSEESLAFKKVSFDLQTTIQTQRVKLGLNQKDFAARCNLPKATIIAYENGTAIPNQKELRAMSRVLGVQLHN